jgi:hypothetical protein
METNPLEVVSIRRVEWAMDDLLRRYRSLVVQEGDLVVEYVNKLIAVSLGIVKVSVTICELTHVT